MTAPLFVVPSKTEAAHVARAVTRQGWKIQQGAQLTERPWDVSGARLVVATAVVNQEVVESIVLAATRGAGVIAITGETIELTTALIDDLRRLGPVYRAAEEFAVEQGHVRLDSEQRSLLRRLARGESIAAAAEAEFLSLRTANRRLAQAREAFGVRTTREAVVEYVSRQG